MRRLLPLLILAGLAGCSSRERSNPFDPANPDTHGGPAGFAAYADDGRVQLKWQAVLGTSLSGFQLYRRTEAESTYRAITGLLPPSTTQYSDVGLLNGLTHFYRLAYVFTDEGERGTAEDVATPGPARPWVVDADVGAVLRLTPDGRRIAFSRGDFTFPSSIATDARTGWVWVSDYSAGEVVVLNPWTLTTVTIRGFVGPSAIAVDPTDQRAWVCDEDDDALYHFDPTGAPVGTPIEPIERPLGVSIDPADGSVWVAERNGGRIRHYSTGHALLGSVPVDRPSRVAVDSVSRAVWVTSFEARQVSRVTAAGVLDKTIPGFLGPIGIAVDSRRGRIWIADALANEVVVLDRTGSVVGRATGIAQTRDISVNPVTGEAWAVAPASGEAVLLSPTGSILRRLGGMGRPVGISVDPGIR